MLRVCVSAQSKFRRAAGAARPADGVRDELAGSARGDAAFPACSTNRQVSKRQQRWFSGLRPVALNTDLPWVRSLRRSRPALGKQHGCQTFWILKRRCLLSMLVLTLTVFFFPQNCKTVLFPKESMKETQVFCGKGTANAVENGWSYIANVAK